MTTWKIIVEVILAILSFGMGYAFWSCVKSPKFLGRTIANQEELEKYISFIGKDKIIEDVKKSETPPRGLTHDALILITISSRIKATDSGRNVAGFIFLIVLIGSYFLSRTFVIINLICFFLMWLSKISASAQNNVFNDINSLIRNIYRWHQMEPENCQNFCLNERPRFATMYWTIISELTNNSDTLLLEKLKGCDFLFMKGVMEQMLHIAHTEGKSKGGGYYMKKEILEVIENFIDKPCPETAILLVKEYPDSLKYFEDSKNAHL